MRYTRDGHFSLDGSGNLVTQRRPSGAGRRRRHHHRPHRRRHQHRVRRHHLQCGQRHRQPARKLKVVDFANPSALIKEGANLYSTGQTATTSASVNLRQGALEGSNVQR